MKKKIEDKVELEPTEVQEEVKAPVLAPLTENFGNGDDNVLRDKLNEVISFLNK